MNIIAVDPKLDIVASTAADYQIRTSNEIEDPDWDAFVERTPGGHHVQTSLWSQVKASLGWRAMRVVVTRAGDIVAGAQLLMRPLPFIGAIGYVSKGPVFTLDDPVLPDLVLNELHQVARDQSIQYLIVQAPNNGQTLGHWLSDKGFRPSITEVAPTATVQLDLRPTPDEILARMKKNTRRYIRHGLRQGIIGREGTKRDLNTFYRLVVATSQRQKFYPYSEEYFSRIWDLFDRCGCVRLFLTEYEGEAVSAQLVIAFRDTVIAKSFGWSGRYGNLGPNHVLDWTTIEWAKSQGYRYYDLEGIDPTAARTILQGESLPATMRRGPTFYKLGFGGQVTLFPGAYSWVYNPILRWGYANVFPKVAGWPLVKKAINRFRIG